MIKYIIHGKTSSDFAAAMLNKPQDRRVILDPFFERFNITVFEFLFTSGIDFNFVSVVGASEDDDVEAMVNIVYSSGNFSNISWSKAYESDAYMKMFEKGHDKMNAYVSSMQVAGIEERGDE